MAYSDRFTQNPTIVTELEAIVVKTQNLIKKIRSECPHTNKEHDTEKDWEGDYGWKCLICGHIGLK